jgi:hypothetical protein
LAVIHPNRRIYGPPATDPAITITKVSVDLALDDQFAGTFDAQRLRAVLCLAFKFADDRSISPQVLALGSFAYDFPHQPAAFGIVPRASQR